jgi:hypothetical protein
MAFAAWILATLLLPWSRTWPIGAALIGILLIAGGSIPGKAEHVKQAAIVAQGQAVGALSGTTIPLGLFNGPVSFLRTLLTFACLGLPLIWVGESVAQPVGPVIADFGFGILYFVWLTKTLGRFADSGHASNWYWGPFCIGVTAISFLPLQHHVINQYEALGLFLLIQTPLALLPSQHQADKFNEDRLRKRRERARRKREERIQRWGRKEVKQPLLRPLVFLIANLVIGCLSALLIYVGSVSKGGVGKWFALSGLFVLVVVWMANVNARFNDAGLIEGWYGSQFVLVVSVASLMPLAFHWVNAYGALAILVLIQTPTVFLRSKPPSEAVAPK